MPSTRGKRGADDIESRYSLAKVANSSYAFSMLSSVMGVLGGMLTTRAIIGMPYHAYLDLTFDMVGSADIVIDPGHGGSEPGAVGQGGLREADLNLAVAKKMKSLGKVRNCAAEN